MLGRLILVEFPSMEQARTFYDSDAYQEIIPLRTRAAISNLFFVEGAEG